MSDMPVLPNVLKPGFQPGVRGMVERVVFTDAEEEDEGRALQEGEVRRVYRAWEVSADR